MWTFQDKLPDDEISVPLSELPDPDADNGVSGESIRQEQNKWNYSGPFLSLFFLKKIGKKFFALSRLQKKLTLPS